ncbi:phage major capsid protein [Diaphorobacter nitroreducens]|uniref:phage major capsid protein n=1 Tax=Diaphorobacter nitroreducens TaxID=164759 RepID=UPI000B59A7F8|nr:phage major capsid protein [Diaphorobacter nitroreducens]
MRISRTLFSLGICALAVAAIAAQAVGVDIAGFIGAHPDVFAGLSALAMLGNTEVVAADLKKVSADLEKVGDQLKAFAEQAKSETAKAVQMSKETKEKVDELLVTQGELQAAQRAAEQILAKIKDGALGAAGAPQSLGEKFANAEGLKNTNFTNPNSFTTKVGSIHAALAGNGTAGNLVVPQRMPGVIAPPDQRLFVRDLLFWGRAASNAIEYVRELGFTNNAGPVDENPADPKPESDITFEEDSAPVRTIAHYIRASKQILDDVTQLQAYIDGRLLYGLKVKEEAQLLNGSGVGLNLNGINTQATAYANPGVTVVGETPVDRLRIAMLQVQLAEYAADGIVLNPIDWAEIELLKESTGGYLFANPQGVSSPILWGRPVVATTAIAVNNFLTGSFRMGAMGWDREDANIAVSNQDRDNFVKNMVTILCEERIALTVFRPEAFVKGLLVTP